MNNIIKRSVLFLLLGVCSVVGYAGITPKISDGGNEYWYYIRFTYSNKYMTGNGEGNTVVQTLDTDTRKERWKQQQWKLVGENDRFYLVNKAGYYGYCQKTAFSYDYLRGTKDKGKATAFKLAGGAYNFQLQTLAFDHARYLNLYKQGDDIWPYEVFNDRGNIVLFEAAGKEPFSVSGIENYIPKDKNTLWYTTPANDNQSTNAWMEYSLPLGNGQLGASIFAGVRNDGILFNEKTLWTGTSKSVGTEKNNNEYGSYQSFGYLNIEDLNPLGKITNYHRDLSLGNATASMSYTFDGVDYKREYIVSNPDSVMAIRLTASKNGKINLKVRLNPTMSKGADHVYYENDMANVTGKLDVVSFCARMRVIADGGEVLSHLQNIEVANANKVTIYLAAATDFDNSNPNFVSNTEMLSSRIQTRLNNAVDKGWDAVYADHVEDYKSFYDRVKLNLDGAANTSDTKSMVDNYKGGTSPNDLMLEQLYFNYGRYLEIASSRGVDLPSNLQGIWSNTNKAPWNADIHANINVQMNYWPAEPTNLSEMHEPFLNYIIKMAESEPWKRYAEESGQQRGWTCYTENNIFGGVGRFAHNYVIENAWYCTHLWQHYRYTLDEKFLAKAFPAMLSATQFWLDRLIERDGKFLCPQEYSPEHGPIEDGVAHAQQLVWELFDNTLKAVDVLGKSVIPTGDLKDLQEKFSRLDNGLAMENGGSHGQLLREWKNTNYNGRGIKLDHRHMSHLMCLYPFSQVAPGSDLFNAAVNSLVLRGDHSTGWSMGWKMNLWARALDGNHAHNILKLALKHSTSYGVDENKGGIYYNLFDSHSPFQIDGNFGACAGIAEMLFQSHGDVLNFLPALPDNWANGSITGLKGIGNFTVGVEWKNGQAQKLTITNVKGQPCLVKCARARAMDEALVTVNGKPVTVRGTDKAGVFEISSDAGDQIVVDFTKNNGEQPSPENHKCGDRLTWNFDEAHGVLVVEGAGAMYDYSVNQPAPWNAYAQQIKDIRLPKGLTAIGSYAFNACEQMAEYVFADNHVAIGDFAFSPSTKTVLKIDDVDYKEKAFAVTENVYSEIVYNRVLASEWGSVVLPFALNAETAKQYDFYQLSAVEGNTITFKYVRYPVANTPYLYKKVDGAACLNMVSDRTTKIDGRSDFLQTIGSWSIVGSYSPFSLSAPSAELATTYVLHDGKLKNSSKGVKLQSFRAYFRGPEYTPQVASTLRVVIEEANGETTDITDVVADKEPGDGVVFDLAGRRVWKTTAGHIYIKNGKKFIAK